MLIINAIRIDLKCTAVRIAARGSKVYYTQSQMKGCSGDWAFKRLLPFPLAGVFVTVCHSEARSDRSVKNE